MVELEYYFRNASAFINTDILWAFFLITCVSFIFMIGWKGAKAGSRYGALVLFVEWLFLVFGTAVFFRETHVDRGYSLIPFISYIEYGEHSYFMERFAINMLNVALFIPIGFLFGFAFQHVSWKNILKFGFYISLSIELLQFFFKKGYAEVDDLIHNVVGCLIGYGVYKIVTTVIMLARLISRLLR